MKDRTNLSRLCSVIGAETKTRTPVVVYQVPPTRMDLVSVNTLQQYNLPLQVVSTKSPFYSP